MSWTRRWSTVLRRWLPLLSLAVAGDATIGLSAADAGYRPPPLRSVVAACSDPAATQAIARCLDAGGSPDACLDRADPAARKCDRDRDGLPDDLEDALATSYAMAFAYDRGESFYPVNLAWYAARSDLVWRRDDVASTARTVLRAPGLDDLARASVAVRGRPRAAWDGALEQGGSFWLCLQGDGVPPRGLAHSLALPGGIDVAAVVHPASDRRDDPRILVTTSLFHAYNEHSGVGDHQGDWEGGGVFVDRRTGQVVAAFFSRHDSADPQRVVPLMPRGAIDPAHERPAGEICDRGQAAAVKGLRFHDAPGPRHHVVVYVARGGHASYDMPGNTRLAGLGCHATTMVRDRHDGQGPQFLPWLGRFERGWQGGEALVVRDGVHVQNVGEPGAPRVGWVRYRGQWGCDHRWIARSWPGPWGNERHPRPWLRRRWPDLATPDPVACRD